MIMKKRIIFLSLFILFFSCQGQEKKETIEYPNNKLKEIDSAINLEK